MSEYELILRITERLGKAPDAELSLRDLVRETGVKADTWQKRIHEEAAWAQAFYRVGSLYKTTLRRIWRAQDELSFQATKGRAA